MTIRAVVAVVKTGLETAVTAAALLFGVVVLVLAHVAGLALRS